MRSSSYDSADHGGRGIARIWALYEAASIGPPLTFLQFSRDFEKQADFLGVQYMYRAGYDPQAFVLLLREGAELGKDETGHGSQGSSTRIRRLRTGSRIRRRRLPRLLPPRQEYLVTTSEFDDVKTRLARIENKRKPETTAARAANRLCAAQAGRAPTPNATGSSPARRPTVLRCSARTTTTEQPGSKPEKGRPNGAALLIGPVFCGSSAPLLTFRQTAACRRSRSPAGSS